MKQMNNDLAIRNIQLLYVNQPSRRKVKVILTNGSVIYIERCHEAYEQYGGTERELFVTLPIAEKFNDWLHGE